MSNLFEVQVQRLAIDRYEIVASDAEQVRKLFRRGGVKAINSVALNMEENAEQDTLLSISLIEKDYGQIRRRQRNRAVLPGGSGGELAGGSPAARGRGEAPRYRSGPRKAGRRQPQPERVAGD